jgi:hypothetical protein
MVLGACYARAWCKSSWCGCIWVLVNQELVQEGASHLGIGASGCKLVKVIPKLVQVIEERVLVIQERVQVI